MKLVHSRLDVSLKIDWTVSFSLSFAISMTPKYSPQRLVNVPNDGDTTHEIRDNGVRDQSLIPKEIIQISNKPNQAIEMVDSKFCVGFIK